MSGKALGAGICGITNLAPCRSQIMETGISIEQYWPLGGIAAKTALQTGFETSSTGNDQPLLVRLARLLQMAASFFGSCGHRPKCRPIWESVS